MCSERKVAASDRQRFALKLVTPSDSNDLNVVVGPIVSKWKDSAAQCGIYAKRSTCSHISVDDVVIEILGPD